MLFLNTNEIKTRDIDSGETCYRYVRVFTKKADAEAYAKKAASKEKGIPEELIFQLIGKTETAVPADVTLLPVT